MGSDDQKNLGSDVIIEILTRTSSKTLDTCKCVSKNWHNLIYDTNFKRMYCSRTNSLAGYFIQSRPTWTENISEFIEISEKDNKNSNKIDKFPEYIKILASCNQGLLCCLNFREDRYYVCKPATRQWQPLPNPKLGYLANAVAIMVLGSTPLRYKIICLYELPHKMDQYQIFDSKSWSWRRPKNLYHGGTVLSLFPAIRVGKSVHWLTFGHKVLSFHEPDESFHSFSLPQAVHELSCRRLVNYKGKLGVMSFFEEPDNVMELWVKYNHDGWTLEMATSMSSIGRRNWMFPYRIEFYDADIVFITYGSDLFYKLDDRSVRKVKLNFNTIIYPSPYEFFEFRSDWEPVHLKGGRLMSCIRSIKTLMCS